ncbi:hypothetical protein [Polaromonas sp. YR568]|uniref:hypothetical protein n=1 Tax=Polaromonas sp. YR568 TaxID=1855301 RepID=UPI003137C662
MNKSLWMSLLVCVSPWLMAQTPAPAVAVTPAVPAFSIDAERSRIAADRARLEAGFLAEDAACYKRFAVNNCLAEVNVRRREAMADLRRQDIELNDLDRRARAAEQLRKTEEKSSPQALRDAEERRAKAVQEYQERIEREKKKIEERALTQSDAKARSDAAAGKLSASEQKARDRADKQAAAAEEAKKFNERQKEAEERRARHEEEQRKRVKPPAKSLPLPS